MNFIFISPNYPSGHWKYIAALREAGCNILGIGDAGDETFPAGLRGNLTEYYRVGDLHNYDEVYRACAYYISRYGRPNAIDSLNGYWADLVEALHSDFICCEDDMCGFCYADTVDSMHNSGKDILPECELFTTVEAAVAFGEKHGYPLLAVPAKNKRLGKRLIAAEAGLRLLLRGEKEGAWLLCAQYDGEPVSVDGLFAWNEHCFTPVAVAAHALNPDGSFYSLPVSEELAAKTVQLALEFCRGEFFHINAVKLTKGVSGVGKKGDIVFNSFEDAPPHEFIIECMNAEFGCDLRGVWAKLSAEEEDMPEFPLTQVCCAGAAFRSFGRSYKNSHEKILRRLTVKLTEHSLNAEADKASFSDYHYIFSGETSAELKRTIKFITEDFDKCQ